MIAIRYFATALSLLALTACGGSGGGNSNNTPTQNANTSSSASSSTTGPVKSAIVFEEQLNSEWGKFKVWQWSTQTGQGQGFTESPNNGLVQWQVINAGSADHNNVVEVSYGNQQFTNAHFQIMPDTSSTLDLSSYGTGTLSFDINVLDWGGSFDPNLGHGVFAAQVECVWPCVSHWQKFAPLNLNEWKHIEINIADLVNQGLDLTHVNSGFLIKPFGFDQHGVRFQLDNIKWTKGAGSLITPKTIFAEHFNQGNAADSWQVTNFQGSVSLQSKYLWDALWMYPIWTTSFDDWALMTTIAQPINIKNKKASVLMNIFSPLAGDSAIDVRFSFIAIDSNGNQVTTDESPLRSLTPNEWVKASVDIGGSFPAGFDASKVQKIGIRFRANGKIPEITGGIQLDEILITE